MAFSSTITDKSNSGNERSHKGTWTTDTTGGDIDTGLKVCKSISFTISGAAVAADSVSVNETLPCAGNAVTIVCTSGADGTWEAKGY